MTLAISFWEGMQRGRFRAVKVEASFATRQEAQDRLQKRLAEYAVMPPEEFHQGDETGKPVDFFTPIVSDERLKSEASAT